MAYIGANLIELTNPAGSPPTWQYSNFADSLTTIKASGYFDPAAPAPNLAGDIAVNDEISIFGSDGFQQVYVTGLSPITVALIETTVSVTLEADPVPTDTIDLKLCFDGECVTLFIPELNVAGNSSAAKIRYTGLPQLYWPKIEHQLTGIAVIDNNVYTEGGTFTLATNGDIEIGQSNALTLGFVDPNDFSATANNCGHQGLYITYLVA